MYRTLLAAVALCCLATTAQAAQGMNLRWDACLADGGVLNRDFACDTNTGSENLFVSFQLDSAFAPVDGVDLYMNIATPAGPPGLWWQFKNVGSCRPTALVPSSAPLVPGGSCVDYWQGLALGGLSGYVPDAGSSGVNRLSAIYALPAAAAASLDAGTEYFCMRFTITHAKTVGAGSCPGCLDPVCLGLERLVISRPAGYSDLALAEETIPGSSTASWQGAATSSTRVQRDNPYFPNWFFRTLTCSAAIPARNQTWGSIKSLYH